ncbi:MAG: helix-turn-helix transcriptional regulator [Alphaproteobacteria bacterium]|nr:helix-turn-helix transcriptional regulator [Alphaproteobacteria bacterium]
MTTHEVADYLRIKERKVYDLVRQGDIPCSRRSGKWLFPKALIDRWVLQGVRSTELALGPAPAIIAGSHDPLLDWSVRESNCGLAILAGGSLDGLSRVADGAAAACGAHMRDPDTGTYNVPWVARTLAARDVVVIRWARRTQGLLVAAGNPLGLSGIADLGGAAKPRVGQRQPGAGSQMLLGQLLDEANIDLSQVDLIAPPARSEGDLAQLIADGKADAGVAIAAVARTHRLDFVSLATEYFDLVIRRYDYFEPPIQALLAFARSAPFAVRADELTGYDVSEVGQVVWNGD